MAGGGAALLQLPTKVLFLNTAGGPLYHFGFLKSPACFEWILSAVAQPAGLHVKSHFERGKPLRVVSSQNHGAQNGWSPPSTSQ